MTDTEITKSIVDLERTVKEVREEIQQLKYEVIRLWRAKNAETSNRSMEHSDDKGRT